MSAPATVSLSVFVMIDEDGNHAVHIDRDELKNAYDNDIGGDDILAKRVIALTINVPLPRDLAVTVDVPDEPQTAMVEVG